MSSIYKHVHILLLTAYTASLLFNTFKVYSETSLPFVLGAAWGISKLWGVLFRGQTFKVGMEGILLAVLYLYLTGIDTLVHGGSIFRTYYISFALNGIIFLLLVDDLSKDVLLREKMMQVFSTSAVLVALLYSAGVFTTQSQSGRLTFMHQNENDLAVNLLIAFIFVAVSFVRSAPKKTLSLVLTYASTLLLLNALINTGTRFAMFSVCVVLLFLAATTFQRRNTMKSCMAYICTSMAFLVVKILSFQPALERFSPEVDGNNLTDLGGRIPLWRSSIDVFLEHPFFGLGYDGFQQHVLQKERYFEMPHNFFLEVAAMGGLVGVALLSILVSLFIARAVIQSVRFGVLDGLIWGVAIFVISTMLNITHMKSFWFLAAYFIAVVSSTQKNVMSGAGQSHVI